MLARVTAKNVGNPLLRHSVVRVIMQWTVYSYY